MVTNCARGNQWQTIAGRLLLRSYSLSQSTFTWQPICCCCACPCFDHSRDRALPCVAWMKFHAGLQEKTKGLSRGLDASEISHIQDAGGFDDAGFHLAVFKQEGKCAIHCRRRSQLSRCWMTRKVKAGLCRRVEAPRETLSRHGCRGRC